MEDSRLTSRIKQFIAGHPITAFLLILYPISLLFFLPTLLGKSGLGLIPVDIPVQPGILASTVLGLTGLAFLVTHIADGKAATRELLRHYYKFRAGPQWYVLALFLCPMLLLGAGLVTRGGAALSPFREHGSEILTIYALNVVVIAVLISLCEEGGWMAFVTTRLQRRWGPVAASLAVAPLMGLIHFPLLLTAGGVAVGGGRVPLGLLGIAVFQLLFLYSGPIRIIVTWVYNSTGGSLLVVALLHASLDTTVSGAVLTTFYPGVDGIWLNVALAVVALAVILLTRGRLGYRGDQPIANSEVPMSEAARA